MSQDISELFASQNDPNGPFYDAKTQLYHLFFQYNPNAAIWGDMTWGHAVSFDMVAWQELPTALSPSETYDREGAFSGSVTLVNGVPVIAYTCVEQTTQFQAQCVARPSDASDALYVKWTKDAANPVYSTEFGRDPTTAWRVTAADGGARWQMALGAPGAAALLTTRRDDFLSWERTGDLFADAHYADVFWECPDLYALPGAPEDVRVFKASVNLQPFRGQDAWSVGRFNASRSPAFEPLAGSAAFGERLYDHGMVFYASKTFFDAAASRQVLFGWVNEEDAESEHVTRGWAGVQSLPREVRLRSDGVSLRTPPVPALEQLRGAEERVAATLAPNSAWALPLTTCDTQLDVHISIVLPASASDDFDVGVRVLTSATRDYFTSVGIVRVNGNTSLYLRRDNASITTGAATAPIVAPLNVRPGSR